MDATVVPPPIVTDPTSLLWLFFWVGFLVTAGFAFGLIYHWVRYAGMYPISTIVLPVYVAGVLVFIGAMLAALAIV